MLEHSPLTRAAVVLAAFRRNSDLKAKQLRTELPVLLGRLIAEVRGAAMELRVETGPDGVVSALVAFESAGSATELVTEAAALLQPAAELTYEATAFADGPGTRCWPLVCSSRSVLGFHQQASSGSAAEVWSTTGVTALGNTPELVELVSPYEGVGIRVRVTAGRHFGPARPSWDADLAIVTRGAEPSLRLRAAVRTRYPGLEVAATPDGEPAVLRVSVDELPAAFAVPVAGEQPIAGTYVGTAAPLPLHPSRRTTDGTGSLLVGTAVTVSGRRVPVALSLAERLRHVHVLGRTGTGKSSFLAGFVHQLAATGSGALVLDPHGRLVDRIVAELPAEAVARTWVIRCGDVDNPVPLNPLAVEDRVRREIAIDDVNAAFQYLFDPKHTGIVGPRFRERVAMGLRALAAANGPRASLLDVPAALADRAFMKRAAVQSGDDRLIAWVQNDESNSRSGEYADLVSWVNSKFEGFSSTAAMRAILGSGADALDTAAVMDEGRIVLVDLSKGELGESATRLLGYLYLNEAWVGAMQRRNPANPFTVIVDEAQAMISGSLSAMLSEGRKFGLSVVLAHQYLGQLDADLLPAIDGNVATTVAFRGAGADAPALRQRFGERVDTPTLMTLPDLSAITLRTAADVTGEPYTLIVDHNERVRARADSELAEFSSALTELTNNQLVDPYRSATAAAAAGTSGLKSRSVAPKPKPAPDPPSSFLDDWLAKREAMKRSTDLGDPDPAPAAQPA